MFWNVEIGNSQINQSSQWSKERGLAKAKAQKLNSAEQFRRSLGTSRPKSSDKEAVGWYVSGSGQDSNSRVDGCNEECSVNEDAGKDGRDTNER